MKSSFLWHYIFINESNLFTTTDDFLFLTLKSWFYSCMPPANTADILFHSLWEASTPQRQKKPILFFSLTKNFIQDLWLFRCSSCFSLVKKIIWPIRICAVYYKSYSFLQIYLGVNLCLYAMYDKPTYIHTVISKSLIQVNLLLFLNMQQK